MSARRERKVSLQLEIHRTHPSHQQPLPDPAWVFVRRLMGSDMAQNLQGIHLLAHSLCILSIRGMNYDNKSACVCVCVRARKLNQEPVL